MASKRDLYPLFGIERKLGNFRPVTGAKKKQPLLKLTAPPTPPAAFSKSSNPSLQVCQRVKTCLISPPVCTYGTVDSIVHTGNTYGRYGT